MNNNGINNRDLKEKFSQSKELVILAYLFFLILNLTYLNVFALHKEDIDSDNNFGKYFNFPLNTDEDKGSLPEIRMLEEGQERGLSNTAGMAYFYLFLKQTFGFSYETLPLISFIINNIAIFFSYHYFVKIGLQLGLGMSQRWIFFLNPALIYYSQLINKEVLSLLFVLAFVYYLARRQHLKLFLVALISIPVRIQMGVIGVSSLWLYQQRHYLRSIFFLYIVTSLAGAKLITPDLSEVQEALEKPGGATGFVLLTQILNQKYYIGSLLLNPIKSVQYLYDWFQCLWNFITPDNRVNLYFLRDVPVSLVLIYYSRSLLKLFSHLKIYVQTACRPLLTVTIAFFFVMLMNPIVHARYLFPISYNLLLLAAYVSKNIKKPVRETQIHPANLTLNPI